MDLKEIEALGDAADRHWYYVSKAMMVEAEIGQRGLSILDVGAGSGWFSRWLLRRGVAREATCIDPGYAAERDETVDGRRLSFRRSTGPTDADLVLLMDVLEHVEDDRGLLEHYVRAVRPGTRILITVPAFALLWSAHDDYLEHKRRYTLRQLAAVAEAAGARRIRAHYYFAAIFPAALAVRLLRRHARPERSDLRPAPAWLNGLLMGLLSWERRWMFANRLLGLSVVMLCET